MVLQSVRNLPEFHGVFADSLVSIINHLKADEPTAKKIMVFNIRQAYILYRMDTTSERALLDRKRLEYEVEWQSGRMKKLKVKPSYDYLLKEELDEMELDKMAVDELEIKMFTYMTLAGIKPVQNTQQRAAGYARFAGGTDPIG